MKPLENAHSIPGISSWPTAPTSENDAPTCWTFSCILSLNPWAQERKRFSALLKHDIYTYIYPIYTHTCYDTHTPKLKLIRCQIHSCVKISGKFTYLHECKVLSFVPEIHGTNCFVEPSVCFLLRTPVRKNGAPGRFLLWTCTYVLTNQVWQPLVAAGGNGNVW